MKLIIATSFALTILLGTLTADASGFGKHRRSGNSADATYTSVTVETLTVGAGCNGGQAGNGCNGGGFFHRLRDCRASRGNGCSGGQAGSGCNGGSITLVPPYATQLPAPTPPPPVATPYEKKAPPNQAPMPKEKKQP